MIRKSHKRQALTNAVKTWSRLTNNHYFTTIDILNSGILDEVKTGNGKKIATGFNSTFSSVNGGLCELQRIGLISQIQEQEEGQMRLWRYNGEAIV